MTPAVEKRLYAWSLYYNRATELAVCLDSEASNRTAGLGGVTQTVGWEKKQNTFRRGEIMKEPKVMRGCFYLFVLLSIVSALLLPALAAAQDYPIMNRIADKVIQRYQNSTCEQLWQKKSEPKPAMEQRVVGLLRSDPQMRRAFLDRVAAPIANRMFECGMIP